MAKIIVALDYTNPLDALEMCAKLRGVVDGFKINHALWSQSVYIKDYTDAGELFVDCKLWDTPNTVKTVLQKIVDKGATMTTVSTLNNLATFDAIEEFKDSLMICGVTYLTSWGGSDLLDILNYLPSGAKSLWRDNMQRAQSCMKGIVCSPLDLEKVAEAELELYGTHKYKKVCPGIGMNPGQNRTVTPMEAKAMGADYLIIGRTITNAVDPVFTAQDIKESLTARRH